jgi:predicted RNA-binding protein YlqC (UPF0109 family)
MLTQLIAYCVARIVDKTEQVIITQKQVEDKTVIHIQVAPQDLAKVIGREGRTFKSLRALLQVVDPTTRTDLVVDSIAQQ